jgi:hypothetical protein
VNYIFMDYNITFMDYNSYFELQYLQTVVVMKLAGLNYNICVMYQLHQMQVMTLANHITCEL